MSVALHSKCSESLWAVFECAAEQNTLRIVMNTDEICTIFMQMTVALDKWIFVQWKLSFTYIFISNMVVYIQRPAFLIHKLLFKTNSNKTIQLMLATLRCFDFVTCLFQCNQLILNLRLNQILDKINIYSIRVHHIKQRRKRDREKESSVALPEVFLQIKRDELQFGRFHTQCLIMMTNIEFRFQCNK